MAAEFPEDCLEEVRAHPANQGSGDRSELQGACPSASYGESPTQGVGRTPKGPSTAFERPHA